MSTPLLISSLAMLMLAQPSQPSDPEEAKARAQQLIKEANLLFDQKKLSPALKLYEAAYAEYPSPKILYNIASVYLVLGESTRAAQHFSKFLAEAGPGPESEQHTKAKKMLGELEKMLGRLAIICQDAGAKITLDKISLGPAPVEPQWVQPGEHHVTAELEGRRRFDATVGVEAGSNIEFPIALAAIPPAPALAPVLAPIARVETAEPENDSVLGAWWFWTAVGVVAAGAAFTAVALTSGGGDFAREGELGVISTRDLEAF